MDALLTLADACSSAADVRTSIGLASAGMGDGDDDVTSTNPVPFRTNVVLGFLGRICIRDVFGSHALLGVKPSHACGPMPPLGCSLVLSLPPTMPQPPKEVTDNKKVELGKTNGIPWPIIKGFACGWKEGGPSEGEFTHHHLHTRTPTMAFYSKRLGDAGVWGWCIS
jgi:hypothetical protein